MSHTAFGSCEADFSTLEQFYESSKNEDFNTYISLMDTEYIYDYLADKEYYENYVKAAWDVYETKSYLIDLLKCNEIPTGSIIFANVKSTLIAEGEEIDLDRDYAAVFENGKIQFVMDFETFMMHQNYAYMLQYYNYTSELVNEELNDAESLIQYLETYEPIETKTNWFWYIIIIILTSIIYFNRNKIKNINIKKPKKFDTTKIKNRFHSAKNTSIKKIKDTTIKVKGHMKPRIEKLKNKTKEVYDNREKYISKAKQITKKQLQKIKKK